MYMPSQVAYTCTSFRLLGTNIGSNVLLALYDVKPSMLLYAISRVSAYFIPCMKLYQKLIHVFICSLTIKVLHSGLYNTIPAQNYVMLNVLFIIFYVKQIYWYFSLSSFGHQPILLFKL